jgi:hypothetical protein
MNKKKTIFHLNVPRDEAPNLKREDTMMCHLVSGTACFRLGRGGHEYGETVE